MFQILLFQYLYILLFQFCWLKFFSNQKDKLKFYKNHIVIITNEVNYFKKNFMGHRIYYIIILSQSYNWKHIEILLEISIFSTRKKFPIVLSLILKFKWFSKGKRNKILESTTLFQISRISRTNEISDKFMNTANNYRKTFEKGLWIIS